MSDPVFVDEPKPEPEQPVDYVANPLRVQRALPPTAIDSRPWVKIDLVALAQNIVDRETECRELRGTVAKLNVKVSILEDRIERIEAQRDEGRLVRALRSALADVEACPVADGDDEDECGNPHCPNCR